MREVGIVRQTPVLGIIDVPYIDFEASSLDIVITLTLNCVSKHVQIETGAKVYKFLLG